MDEREIQGAIGEIREGLLQLVDGEESMVLWLPGASQWGGESCSLGSQWLVRIRCYCVQSICASRRTATPCLSKENGVAGCHPRLGGGGEVQGR